MGRLILGAVAGLVLLFGAPVGAGEKASWTGEVVDMACYISNGAHGKDHAGCAKACAASGQPMGLLQKDGTLLLLAMDHKDEAPYESLKGIMGETTTIAGKMSEKGGVKMVTVSRVQDAKKPKKKG